MSSTSPPNPPRTALRSLDDALAELLRHAQPLSGVQHVSTFDADGRVLAADLASPLNVPGHHNSAMDGYALRVADVPQAGVVLPQSQRVPAGSAAQPLAAGSVARIFTGAPIPAGADAVLMQEDTTVVSAPDESPPRVQIHRVPKPGQWIRRAGEDVALGQVALQRGQRLGPAHLGLAASLGAATLPVAPQVRVAMFSTGDELVMPGAIAPADMPAGAIYNSNRFFLRTLLQRLGCVVTDLGIVPDQRQATIDALAAASAAHDLILTSGGVSVGEEDHIKPAVQALGSLDLWSIAIKPGKPFAYGQIARPGPANGGCHFIGLPGNPVSSFVTFCVLVRPFVLALQGAADLDVARIALRADFDWPKPDKRREFLRARRNASGGLDLFANQSSGVLTSMAWGDVLVDNPPGQAIARGDAVRAIALSELLS